MNIQGNVVVVTGTGNGIGRELALLLLSRGARVAGVDLNPAWLEETRLLAGEKAADFDGFVINVTQLSIVESLPERVRTSDRTIAVCNSFKSGNPMLPLHWIRVRE